MRDVERKLLDAGAVLVKENRHRFYELDGRRFTVSRGTRGTNRGRYKQIMTFLRNRP